MRLLLQLLLKQKTMTKQYFIAEIKQSGLFQITGYDEEELEAIIGIFCPNTLFPYAREIIANMIAKGGFPEFILQPINFDALYKESKNRAAGISDNEDSSEETTH